MHLWSLAIPVNLNKYFEINIKQTLKDISDNSGTCIYIF